MVLPWLQVVQRIAIAAASFAIAAIAVSSDSVDFKHADLEQRLSGLIQRADHRQLLLMTNELDRIEFSPTESDTKSYLIWRLASGLLSSQPDNSQDKDLALSWCLKASSQTMLHADNLSIYGEKRLVEIIMAASAALPRNSDHAANGGTDFLVQRVDWIKLSLHCWRRIESEIDSDWDPSDDAPLPPERLVESPTAEEVASFRKANEIYRKDSERFAAQKDLHDFSNRFSPRILLFVRELCSTPPFHSATLEAVVRRFVDKDQVVRELFELDVTN